MDSTSGEDLSALMDGELASEPTRFLLRRLDHDPALAAKWSRWHLIRACLASDPARMSGSGRDGDFAARVAAALESESTTHARQPRQWIRYVGGGAIAVGVAVAALLLNAPELEQAMPSAPREAAVTVPASPQRAAGVMVSTPSAPAWSLAPQTGLLMAQPAAANVDYGTGLLQPDYLRTATFARDADEASMVLLPPDDQAASASGARARQPH